MWLTPEALWAASRVLHRRGWCRGARLLKGINFLLFRAVLPPEAEVGRGVILSHYGLGVVLHPNVKIGDRVRIYHRVTIAAEAVIGTAVGVTIGDDVMIGTGAVVVARVGRPLTIGCGASIGANAVVTRDVAAGVTVAGVPAKVIPSRGRDASSSAT